MRIRVKYDGEQRRRRRCPKSVRAQKVALGRSTFLCL
jgi:hypothetical protein